MAKRLEGKTAFITAAGQGIGRAAALAFAAEGAKVIATDIDEAKLADLAKTQGIVATHRLDVTDAAQVQACARASGPITSLINVAGYVHSGTILESQDKDWAFAWNLNVLAWSTPPGRSCRRWWPTAAGRSSTSPRSPRR